MSLLNAKNGLQHDDDSHMVSPMLCSKWSGNIREINKYIKYIKSRIFVGKVFHCMVELRAVLLPEQRPEVYECDPYRHNPSQTVDPMSQCSNCCPSPRPPIPLESMQYGHAVTCGLTREGATKCVRCPERSGTESTSQCAVSTPRPCLTIKFCEYNRQMIYRNYAWRMINL